VNVVALIAWIAAAVCFIAGIYVPKLTNAGLALLTVGLIIEFGARSHSVTF
jgi:hypothetical protein